MLELPTLPTARPANRAEAVGLIVTDVIVLLFELDCVVDDGFEVAEVTGTDPIVEITVLVTVVPGPEIVEVTAKVDEAVSGPAGIGVAVEVRELEGVSLKSNNRSKMDCGLYPTTLFPFILLLPNMPPRTAPTMISKVTRSASTKSHGGMPQILCRLLLLSYSLRVLAGE